MLLTEEVAGRDRSSLATRRARAAFPTGKTFEAWNEATSSIPAPTQAALRTLEWIGRAENLVVCGPAGTGKTFLLEALVQAAVEAGRHVAWFTLEALGVLVRRHRADDSVTKAITRILRADLVIVYRYVLPPRRFLMIEDPIMGNTPFRGAAPPDTPDEPQVRATSPRIPTS